MAGNQVRNHPGPKPRSIGEDGEEKAHWPVGSEKWVEETPERTPRLLA